MSDQLQLYDDLRVGGDMSERERVLEAQLIDAKQREERLQRTVDALTRKCDVLARNMSCLYRTAVDEIALRDRELASLKSHSQSTTTTLQKRGASSQSQPLDKRVRV